MIEHNVDLSRYNTLALPARAQRLARPGSVAELVALLRERDAEEPLFVLGGGSNVVLQGDLPGLTLMPQLHEIERVSEDDRQVRIRAGAGVIWDQLVAETVARGWYGLENLALIPGSAGAAPVQNIGAYGVELADVLESVEAVSVASGKVVRFAAGECEFRYRDSLFKSRCRGQFVITHITLCLEKTGQCRIAYRALAECFAGTSPEQVRPAAVRRAVMKLRQSKLPDPRTLANAGSFFKNPLVTVAHYQRLQASHPQLVAYPQADGVKLAAGWLIERAGWKGRSIGPVGMHREQALVLVNHGGAGARQVLQLAAAVRADVEQLFGVTLEQEPVLLP